jgi:hypothetical protein
MVAYEFYFCDEEGRYQLIGVLPERRRNPRRVTRESVMGWGKLLIGDVFDANHLYFVQVDM